MIIVGVDEVGRGCLVGNVVAGAVILPDDFYLQLHIKRLNCSLHCQHRGLQNINVIDFTCA
jgi:ribonuclease HII